MAPEVVVLLPEVAVVPPEVLLPLVVPPDVELLLPLEELPDAEPVAPPKLLFPPTVETILNPGQPVRTVRTETARAACIQRSRLFTPYLRIRVGEDRR